MPRIRTIKPEFPQSESMGRISRDARLLFILLWTLADDSGRLRGHSRMLASLLYPYDDDSPALISDWMDELVNQNCVVLYDTSDGSHYLQIVNWDDHQKIDRPSKSKLPEPNGHSLANPRECSTTTREPSSLDLRTKDQGSKDQGEELVDAPTAKKKRFTKPTVEEIAAYCSERKNSVVASKFWDWHEARGWKLGKASMIDWKATVRTWEQNGQQNGQLKNKPSESEYKPMPPRPIQ